MATFLEHVHWVDPVAGELDLARARASVLAQPDATWAFVFENVLATQCPLLWGAFRSRLGPPVLSILERVGLAPWRQVLYNAVHRTSDIVR